jgi:hypothetical protein
MMTLWQFETALWWLRQLDMQELVDAGAIDERDSAAWEAFQADRVGWFLSHQGNAECVWRAMLRSMRGTAAEQTASDNIVEFRPKAHSS